MKIKRFFLVVVLLNLTAPAWSDVSVTTIDFLDRVNVDVNAAGPLFVQVDTDRNRIIAANTLSSSISIVDGRSHDVVNIPLGGRVLQHLKSEAMTLNKRTGDVYLIGTNCFYIVSPDKRSAQTVRTRVQYESIAVDEATGNVFFAGRESKELGFYDAAAQSSKTLDWLDHEEKMINLNQTPPPPLRKAVADNALGKIVAVDGYTSTLYLFDPRSGDLLDSRPLSLASGGRWHLAGYNEQTHRLYIVTETDRRKVIQGAKIDIVGRKDVVVPLPELTEGVGITYNPVRDEVYVPYDNFPTVHVVGFTDGGSVEEIKLPAYGNDASAVDLKNNRLYVASWAHGEIDVVDLETRSLKKRITDLGIIPHMFSIAFNPISGLIYFPKGATAVNGTFGAALTALDPGQETHKKIATGWAPVDLIEMKDRNSFLVFNSEDQFAEVFPDGRYEMHELPYDYPVCAAHNPDGDVYLSYGPHQSYWPTVYIWGAKNGILTIDKNDLGFYDRRIPRQAHKMAFDKNGVAYFTQNNWGAEPQFLGRLGDGVRLFDAAKRIAPGDTVEREITQRILEYDPQMHRLYLVRIGEADGDRSILQIIDPDSQKTVSRLPLGLTATDLIFDDQHLYVANFESNSVSIVDKRSFAVKEIPTGDGPFRLCRAGGGVYVINHSGNTLQLVKENEKAYNLPRHGRPDNVFVWGDKPIVTSFSEASLFILRFDPENESFTLLHEEKYPYGGTRVDTRNVSFYVNGQFGDAVFTITRGKVDRAGRLWVADFLSGKLFILSDA